MKIQDEAKKKRKNGENVNNNNIHQGNEKQKVRALREEAEKRKKIQDEAKKKAKNGENVNNNNIHQRNEKLKDKWHPNKNLPKQQSNTHLRKSKQVQKKKLPPVGLMNFGSTCFLNAVIQCLKVADDRNWEEVERKVKGTSARTATIWEEYLRAIESMKEGRRAVLSPFALRNAIERTNPMLDCSIQQDAHELLLLLRDSMAIESQAWGGSGWELSCQGKLCSTLICNNCKHTSPTNEDSHVISLEIPDGRPNLTVMDCWKSFFSEECLLGKDGWSCGECKTSTFATKQFKMSEEPSLLVIHLKRFSTQRGRLHKCEDPVTIPLKITLTKSQYELRGLVRHHGQSIARGHYTAEIHESSSGWWRCDDKSVSKTTRERDRASRDAYLLFYKKAHTDVRIPQVVG